MLTLLLARQGIDVTILESHKDFDRDFRGDTVHPSTLEVLDQLGLADRLLQIPHGKMSQLVMHTPDGTVAFLNIGEVDSRFPFIAILPQVKFLDFLAEEIKRYPNAHLLMGATMQRLVEEGTAVKGIVYRDSDNKSHEIRAALTVGADGRFSRVRHALGWEPVKTSPPMDVLWFRLPRQASDAGEGGGGYIGRGYMMILLAREDEWQVGYVIPKGGYQTLKVAGLSTLQKNIVELIPWLGDRVASLSDWKQVTLLSVESSRMTQWYKDGLLLIGDAAHVMSPVGGVGINYAIQDAVATSNMLGPKLKSGTLATTDLAAVQRRRQLPVRIIQTFQGIIQSRVVSEALRPGQKFKMPLAMRIIAKLPVLRHLPGRLVAFGPLRERVAM
jgi:2-polyprenyl-6-methoxyphenol hydroxylase-like FAD-dependent oxidoreductase